MDETTRLSAVQAGFSILELIELIILALSREDILHAANINTTSHVVTTTSLTMSKTLREAADDFPDYPFTASFTTRSTGHSNCFVKLSTPTAQILIRHVGSNEVVGLPPGSLDRFPSNSPIIRDGKLTRFVFFWAPVTGSRYGVDWVIWGEGEVFTVGRFAFVRDPAPAEFVYLQLYHGKLENVGSQKRILWWKKAPASK
jgi:hypothetical protein